MKSAYELTVLTLMCFLILQACSETDVNRNSTLPIVSEETDSLLPTVSAKSTVLNQNDTSFETTSTSSSSVNTTHIPVKLVNTELSVGVDLQINIRKPEIHTSAVHNTDHSQSSTTTTTTAAPAPITTNPTTQSLTTISASTIVSHLENEHKNETTSNVTALHGDILVVVKHPYKNTDTVAQKKSIDNVSITEDKTDGDPYDAQETERKVLANKKPEGRNPSKNSRKMDAEKTILDENSTIDINTEIPSLEEAVEDTTKESAAVSVGKNGRNKKNITSTKYITVLLQKNCTGGSESPNTIAVLNTNMLSLLSMSGNQDVNINTVGCHAFLHLKFAVDKVPDDVVKAAMEILSANVTLGDDYKVLKAFLSDDDMDTTNLLKTLRSSRGEDRFRQHGELIAYVVASVCCAFVVFLFIILCCIRCFSSRQTNSLDLCEIPHLNMKPEDYKIMPIPRPSISYQDYGRELLNSTYGGSRSGDTLVSRYGGGADSASSLGNTLRRETVLAHHELRTFDGKRQCARVQSLDIRPQKNVSSWVNSSRENLNTDYERRRLSGIDNSSFEKW